MQFSWQKDAVEKEALFPEDSILNDAEQIVYSRPLTVAHKVHFSGLSLHPVR